jgi:dihydroxyacetone kinase-like predicted kinase
MTKYALEFILCSYSAEDTIRNSFLEFAEDVEVAALGKAEFKVSLYAEEPTAIFDICAQLGRIKSAKAEELK